MWFEHFTLSKHTHTHTQRLTHTEIRVGPICQFADLSGLSLNISYQLILTFPPLPRLFVWSVKCVKKFYLQQFINEIGISSVCNDITQKNTANPHVWEAGAWFPYLLLLIRWFINLHKHFFLKSKFYLCETFLLQDVLLLVDKVCQIKMV